METESDTIKKHNFTPKQKLVLEALENELGVVTRACENSKTNRQVFYKWKNSITEFAERVEEIQEVALDFVEEKAFERIHEKSDAMIIFYLKTKGKKRGYVERTELEHKGGIEHNVTGKLDIAIEQIYGDSDSTKTNG